MDKLFLKSALTACALASASTALATDRAKASVMAMPSQVAEDGSAIETIAIDIRAGGDALWSGTLRIGGQYANASFSQSKNEFAEPCPGEPVSKTRSSSSSHQLNFNISRRNWQQERDKFNINVNWSRPLPACEGEGSNSVGFNRVIEIPSGRTVTIEGAGGVVVRITRQP